MADKPTVQSFTSNSTFQASKANNLADQLATAIEGCLGRGGTGESPNSMEGTLDMDLNRIQNVGSPSNANDAARLSDISDSDATGAASAVLRQDLASADTSKGADLVEFSGKTIDPTTVTATNINVTNIDCDGGAIDDTSIGSTTPSTGAFSSVDIDGGTIDDTSINNTGIGGTTPATGTFTVLNGTSGSVFRKNTVINGNLNIWQRGTSFATIANGTYFADRFAYHEAGDAVHTVSRDTDVPSSVNANYSLKLDCTTADTSIAAGDLVYVTQKIEGYNFLPYVGETATLTFWVKAVKTGTYCVAFRNSVGDRSYVAEYTVSAASTWEKKTINITFDYSGGTWDYTSGIGIEISWVLACGSTYQTTKDTWASGDYMATSSQVNGVDSTDNDFWLSQIQFELSSVATVFEHLPFAKEVELCQRYYEKSYNLNVDPGTITDPGRFIYSESDGTVAKVFKDFAVAKRGNPTITIYNPVTGGTGTVRSGSNNQTTTASEIGENTFSMSITMHTTSQAYYYGHFTADAEL